MAFQPGDKVHVVTTVSSATVLEQDGHLVYVELDNGVEMEYDVSSIILESDYVSPEELAAQERAKKDGELNSVWDAVDSKLQALTKIYHHDISKVLSNIGPNLSPIVEWDSVPCNKRLNILAVLTHIPVDMWKDAYENDKMSRLTMTAYAGIAKEFEENSYGT